MSKNKYETNPIKFQDKLIIKSVDEGSIAEELDLEPNDQLLAINGNKISDELDYHFYSNEDYLVLEIQKEDGEIWELEIEKDPDEIMGLNFYDSLEAKTCKNHCLFCFIDQMPGGLRESLYVKDDDERLSFLTGNYITLTNLTDREISRIIQWKIPVNISIHSTDPIMRRKLLGNAQAGELLDKLKLLSDNNVSMNGQIVLVPGYNDQDLINTLRDLESFFPNLNSVSVVPVGLTRYREGLAPIRVFNKEEAQDIINAVSQLQKEFLEKYGTRFVFLSDEFYLIAEYPIPEEAEYENYRQYENGVGMLRSFLSDYDYFLKDNLNEPEKSFLLVTGKLFYPYLKEKVENLNKINNSNKIHVKCIENEFFGKNISVAGLVTGKDILSQIQKEDLEDIDTIIIPDVMLKNDTELFLDDTTITDLKETFGKDVISIQSEAPALLKEILGD